MSRQYLLRLKQYWSRHGLLKTIGNVIPFLVEHNPFGRFVIYSMDLTGTDAGPPAFPEGLTVVRVPSERELSPEDREALVSFKGERVIEYKFHRFFSKGATLWLGKRGGRLAGFVWSVRQYPVEPYFFPLTESDAHIFDGEIVPEIRGRKTIKYMVDSALHHMKNESCTRVYIETRIQNESALRYLSRSPFAPYGVARKICIGSRALVLWPGRDGRTASDPVITGETTDEKNR